MTALARRSDARLRRLAPCPFGFAPGAPHPVPAIIGSETAALSLAALSRAVVARTPVPLSSMSLAYGSSTDLSAMFIEVTTDFTTGHEDSSPLEYVLGEADHLDAATARGDQHPRPLPDEPDGPFTHGTAEIIVEGERRTVATLTYRQHHAFRFQQRNVLVTMVSRHQLPDLPVLAPVTDLEPYLQQTAAARREQLQRLRNGPPDHAGPAR
jgi:hypothetical protein